MIVPASPPRTGFDHQVSSVFVINDEAFGYLVCSVRRPAQSRVVGVLGQETGTIGGWWCVNMLQLHRERCGENIGVLSQVIVGVGILVKILEQEARLELPANLRFQCVTELVARVQR